MLVAPRALRLHSRWSPLPVVLAGTFMVVLDFFIVNVALPSMQHSLHASASAIEWVVAGYALTSAVLLITAARLGDQIGRRRAFSLGLGVFTLASAACGIAGTPEVLVLSRLVQGIGAALLMPNVLSIIGATYTGPDRTRALGVYGLVMGLAAVGGQLIGGLLVQADIAGLGWRSCFLINVPVGVAALFLAPRVDPRVARAAGQRARPDRNLARHRRCDGGRPAAGRRPSARLAAVDLDLARARAGDPRSLRGASAAVGEPGRRAATCRRRCWRSGR